MGVRKSRKVVLKNYRFGAKEKNYITVIQQKSMVYSVLHA